MSNEYLKIDPTTGFTPVETRFVYDSEESNSARLVRDNGRVRKATENEIPLSPSDTVKPNPVRMIRNKKNGRIYNAPADMSSYFVSYFTENQLPTFVQILHELVNNKKSFGDVESNYSLAQFNQLQVGGETLTGDNTKANFNSHLYTAFLNEQRYTLTSKELTQLVKLTCEENLFKVFSALDKYIETHYDLTVTDSSRKIDFVPSKIKGVLDIILQMELQHNENTFIVQIKVRGFHDVKNKHFDFPIYWPNPSDKKNQHITVEVLPKNQDAPGRDYVSAALNYGMWLGHDSKDKSWHLNKNLAASYTAAFEKHNYFEKYYYEKPPKLIESLHKFANMGTEEPFLWNNDYKEHGSEALLINGKAAFSPEKYSPEYLLPTDKNFELLLKKNFIESQMFDLPDTALKQLVRISCVSELPSIFSLISQQASLLVGNPDVYLPLGTNMDSAFINFKPYHIPGVIDIIMQMGLYPDQGTRANNVATHETNVVATDWGREPIVTVTIRVRGFYNKLTGKFDFPLYWPNLSGSNLKEVLFSMNFTDQTYTQKKDLKDFINCLFQFSHDEKNPDWHLNKALVNYYKPYFTPETSRFYSQQQYARKSESENLISMAKFKNRIWEYFALGLVNEVPVRTPQQEGFHAELAAGILILGEQAFEEGEFKEHVMNLQKTELMKVNDSNKSAVQKICEKLKHLEGPEQTQSDFGTVGLAARVKQNQAEEQEWINAFVKSYPEYKADFNALLVKFGCCDPINKSDLNNIKLNLRETISDETELTDEAGKIFSRLSSQRKPAVVAIQAMFFYELAKTVYFSQDFVELAGEVVRFNKLYVTLGFSTIYAKHSYVPFVIKKLILVSNLLLFGMNCYPKKFNVRVLSAQVSKRNMFSKPDELEVFELAYRIYFQGGSQGALDNILKNVVKIKLKNKTDIALLREICGLPFDRKIKAEPNDVENDFDEVCPKPLVVKPRNYRTLYNDFFAKREFSKHENQPVFSGKKWLPWKR